MTVVTVVRVVTVVTVVTIVIKQMFTKKLVSSKTFSPKTQNVTKLKNLNCDKTQNKKINKNATTQKLIM